MVNMKILDLPLKAKWYEMIESGNKKEEYREIKKYWIGRLAKCGGHNSYEKTGFYCKKAICFSCITRGNGFHPKEYTHVRFRFGYTQRTMLFELESITIGVGNTNWGAPDNECVFILKLGKCIKKMKVRTQQNFNRKTNETVFGISIMPDGGKRYCKYPIGHQEYKDYIPPKMGWIVWDKGQHGLTMSDGELAWSSFDKALRIITLNRCTIGERGGNIHRCQKPVKLYAEILRKNAKEGDKIFDSHLGSGSSRIAAYGLGFDFYATEIDEEYFEAQEERFHRECFGEIKTERGTLVQTNLFDK